MATSNSLWFWIVPTQLPHFWLGLLLHALSKYSVCPSTTNVGTYAGSWDDAAASRGDYRLCGMLYAEKNSNHVHSKHTLKLSLFIVFDQYDVLINFPRIVEHYVTLSISLDGFIHDIFHLRFVDGENLSKHLRISLTN